MADSTTFHASNPAFLEDEIAALVLQLEEIGFYSNTSKGKNPIDQPPDVEVAFASFQSELEDYKLLLSDLRLAQSIGSAVHDDGTLIAEITSRDVQAHEDRLFALQMSNQDPGLSNPPPSIHGETSGAVLDWMSTASGTLAANSVVEYSDDEESEAGPSMTFAERQASVLGKLSQEFKCSVCHDRHHVAKMVKLGCEHRYCVDCTKSLFMRATKDETLFPVRCCKKEIALSLISKHLSAEELDQFERASIEHSTADKVYCSNRTCGKFILPNAIDAGWNRALCEDCGTSTCSICKNAYHFVSDCPDDPALRETITLALDMGWKACYRCHALVMLKSGCNHMTCRCRAEFCYVCGVKWKNCICPHADEHRMLERAEEVVDRDAPPLGLAPAERRRQVQRVHAQLEEHHECTHPGKFQRIFNGPRRGFRCEMCENRHWKYILQCRHCYINVCEDCRRNRV